MADAQDDTLDAKGAEDYMEMYQATMKLLTTSVALFKSLAETSLVPGDQELYRAKVLDTTRAIDLISSKFDAFIQGISPVRPPTEEELQRALGLTQQLSELAAKQAHAEALIKLLTDAVDEFNRLSEPA